MRLHRRACSKTAGEFLSKKVAIRAALAASILGSTAGLSFGQSERDLGAGPASPWSKPFPPARLASLPSPSQTPTLQPAPTTPSSTQSAVSPSNRAPIASPSSTNPVASEPRKLAAVSMLGPIPADTAKQADTAKHADTAKDLPGRMATGEVGSKPVATNRTVIQGERIATALERSNPTLQRLGQHIGPHTKSIPSRHAPTQLGSIDSSVDWNRVPEGGIILESGDQAILEERSQALAQSAVQTAVPRRRILQGLPDREPGGAGIESQMVSNSGSSRSSVPSSNLRSRSTIEIGGPAVEVALEPVIDVGAETHADTSNGFDAETNDSSIQRAAPIVGRELSSERQPVATDPAVRYPHDRYSEGLFLDDNNPVATPEVQPVSEHPSVQLPSPKPTLPRVEVRRPGDWTSSAGERLALAQRISQETLASREQVGMSAEPIEPPVGWSSIEMELRRCLENCDQLLRRNAVFSARDEAMQGLRTLVRAVDTHRQQWTCEKALQQAMVAMKECADFEDSVLLDAKQLRLIINSHTTPVLKEKDIAVMSPTVAGQHYRAFARQSFLIATDGHPWGADLLFALGKTYEREAEQDVPRGMMLRNQATVCFQAANVLGPTRSHISNQLGFNLLQLDRIDEAYQAFKSSLESQPSANAWRNLAELYRRRGAVESVSYALAQADSLSAGDATSAPRTPEIMEVSPEEFARYSPPPVMASTMTAGAASSNPTGSNGGPVHSGLNSTATTSNGPVAVSSKGWLPKVFR